MLLTFLIFISCKDNILDEKYRNENYVYFQEHGKKGEWLKINPELKIKLPKSHSTYFFPNGNRYAELEIIDSFPNRIVKLYNKDDKLIKTTKFHSDSIINELYENGYCYEYFNNHGVIQSEGLIENNMKQGNWKFYREDETLKQIRPYINDTLTGIVKDYWKNGELEGYANIINGVQNGESVFYYENGNVKEKSYLKNGLFHGPMTQYFKNGKIESVRKYWNEKLIDTCKTYYENGQLKLLQFFNLDTITMNSSGFEIKYYPNSKIKYDATFDGNKSNLTIYYENGNLKEKSVKLNNKHHGAFTSYYNSGVKQLEGIANHGFFNGKIKHYSEKGELNKTMIYDNGTVLDSIFH